MKTFTGMPVKTFCHASVIGNIFLQYAPQFASRNPCAFALLKIALRSRFLPPFHSSKTTW